MRIGGPGPTAEEAEAVYGVDLADKGMQAVWVQVQNEENVPYGFLPSGVDPAYYSASEAAYVDLASPERVRSFTYIVVDQTFKGDYTLVDFNTLYDSAQIVEVEEEADTSTNRTDCKACANKRHSRNLERVVPWRFRFEGGWRTHDAL